MLDIPKDMFAKDSTKNLRILKHNLNKGIDSKYFTSQQKEEARLLVSAINRELLNRDEGI